MPSQELQMSSQEGALSVSAGCGSLALRNEDERLEAGRRPTAGFPFRTARILTNALCSLFPVAV